MPHGCFYVNSIGADKRLLKRPLNQFRNTLEVSAELWVSRKACSEAHLSQIFDWET